MRPHLAAPTTPSKRGLLPDDAAAADSAASDSALFCCSPKKFHRALDSPRRGGDSPRRVLEAPANVPDPNQTYGVDSTEFLRSTLARPKQFFDNSTLGINPGGFSPSMDSWVWVYWSYWVYWVQLYWVCLYWVCFVLGILRLFCTGYTASVYTGSVLYWVYCFCLYWVCLYWVCFVLGILRLFVPQNMMCDPLHFVF